MLGVFHYILPCTEQNHLCLIWSFTETYHCKSCFQSLVSNIIKTLTEEYINQFDVNIDVTKLFHPSSDVPVSDDLADEILQVEAIGKRQADEFHKDHLDSNNVKFHVPIVKSNVRLLRTPIKRLLFAKRN